MEKKSGNTKRMFVRSLLAAVILVFIAGCATMESRWEATESADTITAYEDFLKEYPDVGLENPARARLTELYEQRDWTDAAAKNTISSYEDFIRKHPRGKLEKNADARRETLYLEKARDSKSINDYDDFLKRYPESEFTGEVRSKIEKLYFERAKINNTVSAYEEFLERYQHGEFTDAARATIEKLYFERAKINNTVSAYEEFLERYQHGEFTDAARATIEKLHFEQAVNKNTVSAYEDFLKRYSLGKPADDARLRMEKLHFEQAQAEDSISAYNGFLKRYPQGIFANEARSRREILSTIRSSARSSAEWGKIMYPRPKTNIRAKRSVASKVKGQLKAGQPVKVDFLRDSWYAVFQVTEKQRNEKMALGYVYAPLLTDKPESNASGSTAAGEKSTYGEKATAGEKAAIDAPLIEIETESLSIDVKNITFKIAEDGKELLFIEFNRYYLPAFSGIPGKEPKIILEIKNASSLRNDLAVINTRGKLIRQIRSSMNSKTHVARIVLDMEPSKNYLANPVFYEKENLYSLEISEEKGNK